MKYLLTIIGDGLDNLLDNVQLGDSGSTSIAQTWGTKPLSPTYNFVSSS